MSSASLSRTNVETYHRTRKDIREARDTRLNAQTPEYQAQVAKAEGNLQLVNIILMSFLAEQNARVNQHINLS
ncbi:hypothetical protein CGCVW01_v009840 [Colletotrichum viniferum]|nr:hypothetical protein CGCVW01_v009840 [Colletotrichum viniferum]